MFPTHSPSKDGGKAIDSCIIIHIYTMLIESETPNDDMIDGGKPESSRDEASLQDVHQKALFMLKCKTVHKVSQAALENIICDVTSLIGFSINALQKEVDSVLKTNELEIPQTVITAIQDAFHGFESFFF